MNDAPWTIDEERPPDWSAYGSVPIAFEVRAVVDARLRPDGGFDLAERAEPAPWRKDYDVDAGEGPARWPSRFDVSRWGMLVARANAAARIGGAVVVADTPGVDMLEGRDDLAVLWDLRIRPDWRSRGVGTALFRAAERWARRRGKAELKIETQNVNAPACRFYAHMGCTLRTVEPGAYPGLPNEVRYLWYRRLDR